MDIQNDFVKRNHHVILYFHEININKIELSGYCLRGQKLRNLNSMAYCHGKYEKMKKILIFL